MSRLQIYVVTAPGLETVTARELARLDMKVVEEGIRGFVPSRAMCTDNAAMIAATGWYRLRSDGPTSLDAGASPGLRLMFTD